MKLRVAQPGHGKDNDMQTDLLKCTLEWQNLMWTHPLRSERCRPMPVTLCITFVGRTSALVKMGAHDAKDG